MMEIEAMEIHTIETQALETSAMMMEPQTVSVPAYVEIPAPLYQEKPVYEFFKRCFDIAAAVGLLLVGLLPLLIIALLVKANDGGPVFYKQQRVGRYGRVFELYKFRSMCQNADALHQSLSAEQLEQYKREFKLDDDPRVTRIGKNTAKNQFGRASADYEHSAGRAESDRPAALAGERAGGIWAEPGAAVKGSAGSDRILAGVCAQ